MLMGGNCDGSLAACPLRALKDAGRTSASVMWSAMGAVSGVKVGEVKNTWAITMKKNAPCLSSAVICDHEQLYEDTGLGGFCLVLDDLKCCSVLTPDPYKVHSLRPPSCCSLWVLLSVTPSGFGSHVQLGGIQLVFSSEGFTTGRSWKVTASPPADILIHPSQPFYCCDISVGHTCLQLNRSDFWAVCWSSSCWLSVFRCINVI